MIVKNGVEPESVDANNFEMRSVAADRIVLPYTGKIWGDLLHEVEQFVFDAIDTSIFERCFSDTRSIVDHVDAEFLFNIQRSTVRVTAYLHAKDILGTSHTIRVFISTHPAETKTILDNYFSSGCVGLNAEYAKYYTKVYKEWIQKNIFVI